MFHYAASSALLRCIRRLQYSFFQRSNVGSLSAMGTDIRNSILLLFSFAVLVPCAYFFEKLLKGCKAKLYTSPTIVFPFLIQTRRHPKGHRRACDVCALVQQCSEIMRSHRLKLIHDFCFPILVQGSLSRCKAVN